MRVLLVSANRERLPQPVVPIGVLSVAAALRGDHDVRVLDLCFEAEPLRALGEAVAACEPDVVGVGLRNLRSNAYAESSALVSEYGEVVRTVRRATRAPIVLGGAAYSLKPRELLDALGADYGIVGEGEHAMRDLVDRLAAGSSVRRITAGTARGPRLDDLPRPARDLADPRYHAYDGTEPVQTKRGCAYTCAYCDYPDLEGRRVRTLDPETVADEVLALSRMPGVSHVFFVDSVFNAPREHAYAVADALVRRGAPLSWTCYATPAALDERLVAKMAEAGCAGVEIGTDSGTDEGLRRLRKPFTLDHVRAARKLLARHRVRDAHSFVLGARGETVGEARETLAFAAELDPDVAVFMVFTEDRESRDGPLAPRDELLELLAREASKHPRWVVPELGLRFGPRLSRVAERARWRGPSWLRLADTRHSK